MIRSYERGQKNCGIRNGDVVRGVVGPRLFSKIVTLFLKLPFFDARRINTSRERATRRNLDRCSEIRRLEEDVVASKICLLKAASLETWFYLDEISAKKNAGWMEEDGWKVGLRATGAWEFRFPRSRTWFNFSETGRFIYSTNDVEISIGPALATRPESVDGTSGPSSDRFPNSSSRTHPRVPPRVHWPKPWPYPFPHPSKITPLRAVSKIGETTSPAVILKYSRLGRRGSSWRIERWCRPSGGDDATIRLYCLESIRSCTRAIHSSCLACFGIFSTRVCEKEKQRITLGKRFCAFKKNEPFHI